MSKRLLVSDGTRERELQLVGKIVVGRDPACDVSHDHSLLSRRHAEFVTAGELVVVRDLGSRNGVLVNGTRTAEQTLHPGDVVQIGPLRAEYVFDSAPLSITPEDHDAERTAVFPVPSAAAGPSFASAASDAGDDEDATRLVSSRHEVDAALAMPPASTPPLAAGDDDSEVTRFISSPAEDPAPAEATIRDVAAVRPSGESMRTFIFVQLLVLGGLVLAAAAVSFSIEGIATPITSLVVPIVVVVVAGYLVSGVIDRRFIGVLGDARDRDWGG